MSVGIKLLSEKEYLSFSTLYNEACLRVQNRQKYINAVMNKIETDLYLLGSTVVEDQLQDNVPETIRDLRLSNIKIWMLTGDKIDTAYSIGLSCNLLTPKMKTFMLNGEKGDTLEKLLKEFKTYIENLNFHKEYTLIKSELKEKEHIIKHFDDSPLIMRSFSQSFSEKGGSYLFEVIQNNFSIVVDSTFLNSVFSDENKLKLFLTIAVKAYAVICCRISPLMKSKIVKLVKNECQDVVSLAIGDGGNDVSMLLEANIGVGIYGEEGMRAVQSSDFAIGEFKLLRNLLLNTGRINNRRIIKMILYFFYKNFVITIIHYFYGFYNNFSGQTIIDDWFIALYNLIFTALPLTVNAIFEYDLSSKDSIIIDKMLPFLYADNRDNCTLSIKSFTYSVIISIIQGALIFFICIYSQEYSIINSNGDVSNLWYYSQNIYTIVILIVTFRLLITTKFFTWINVIVIVVTSLCAYVLAVILAQTLYLFNSVGTSNVAFSSISFYLNLLFLVGTCFIVDFMIISFETIIQNNLSEKLCQNLNLIKEITFNCIENDKKEDVEKENENSMKHQISIRKKHSLEFKKINQKRVKDKSNEKVIEVKDENTRKGFDDLPKFITDFMDLYIEYEVKKDKQFEFKNDLAEEIESVLHLNQASSYSKINYQNDSNNNYGQNNSNNYHLKSQEHSSNMNPENESNELRRQSKSFKEINVLNKNENINSQYDSKSKYRSNFKSIQEESGEYNYKSTVKLNKENSELNKNFETYNINKIKINELNDLNIVNNKMIRDQELTNFPNKSYNNKKNNAIS